MLLLW
jgi:hypothetical protein